MDLEFEIELKTDLLLEGWRIQEDTLEGVGIEHAENINWLFDWNIANPGLKVPSNIKLPLGTLIRMRHNPKSGYLVKRQDGRLILEKNGEFATTVQWTERSKFYDLLTSDGIEMKKVAQICGEDGLAICHTNYCCHWKDGNQCRFCNLNQAHAEEPDMVLTFKKTEQLGEVAAAVSDEGIDFHMVLTGGALPGTKETEITVKILESIKKHTGFDKVPGFANISPILDFADLERVKEAGLQNICYSLEVWNPDLFKVICPGKSKNIGRENFLRAFDCAVSLFGKGHVLVAFVLGLEEKESILTGIEYLAERGVFPYAIPWDPMPGSKLAGHRPPTRDWFLDTNRRIVDIVSAHIPEMFTEDYHLDSNVLGCYLCNDICTFWDEIRKRMGGLTRVLKKKGGKSVDILI